MVGMCDSKHGARSRPNVLKGCSIFNLYPNHIFSTIFSTIVFEKRARMAKKVFAKENLNSIFASFTKSLLSNLKSFTEVFCPGKFLLQKVFSIFKIRSTLFSHAQQCLSESSPRLIFHLTWSGRKDRKMFVLKNEKKKTSFCGAYLKQFHDNFSLGKLCFLFSKSK